MKNNDIANLANELTYHRYMINQKQAQTLFKDIPISEYIALHSLFGSLPDGGEQVGKIYLSDISDNLGISITAASKMARKLRDKGLVLWAHDGNGSEGTYLTVTPSGVKLVEKQENILKHYYSKIIDSFGEDNLDLLLQLMKRLENVIDDELGEEQ